MEQHFGRSISELVPIAVFLDRASNSLGLDSSISFVLNMAVEEVYTNMVKYNSDGDDHILIRAQVQNHTLLIDVIDFDSKPFEFDKQADVNITAGLHDRTPGGLGIHLVKRFMDAIKYEYQNGKTSIRMVKHLTTHA